MQVISEELLAELLTPMQQDDQSEAGDIDPEQKFNDALGSLFNRVTVHGSEEAGFQEDESEALLDDFFSEFKDLLSAESHPSENVVDQPPLSGISLPEMEIGQPLPKTLEKSTNPPIIETRRVSTRSLSQKKKKEMCAEQPPSPPKTPAPITDEDPLVQLSEAVKGLGVRQTMEELTVVPLSLLQAISFECQQISVLPTTLAEALKTTFIADCEETGVSWEGHEEALQSWEPDDMDESEEQEDAAAKTHYATPSNAFLRKMSKSIIGEMHERLGRFKDQANNCYPANTLKIQQRLNLPRIRVDAADMISAAKESYRMLCGLEPSAPIWLLLGAIKRFWRAMPTNRFCQCLEDALKQKMKDDDGHLQQIPQKMTEHPNHKWGELRAYLNAANEVRETCLRINRETRLEWASRATQALAEQHVVVQSICQNVFDVCSRACQPTVNEEKALLDQVAPVNEIILGANTTSNALSPTDVVDLPITQPAVPSLQQPAEDLHVECRRRFEKIDTELDRIFVEHKSAGPNLRPEYLDQCSREDLVALCMNLGDRLFNWELITEAAHARLANNLFCTGCGAKQSAEVDRIIALETQEMQLRGRIDDLTKKNNALRNDLKRRGGLRPVQLQVAKRPRK